MAEASEPKVLRSPSDRLLQAEGLDQKSPEAKGSYNRVPSKRLQALQSGLGNAGFSRLMTGRIETRRPAPQAGASLIGSAGDLQTSLAPEGEPLEPSPLDLAGPMLGGMQWSPASLEAPGRDFQRPAPVLTRQALLPQQHISVARRDLHSGAAVPDAQAQQDITTALDPRAVTDVTTGTVTIVDWGGRAPGAGLGTPTAAQTTVRQNTLRDMKAAVYRHLDAQLAELQARLSRYNAHHVQTLDLEGAGRAAVEVAQRHLGPYIRNAAGAATRRHEFRGYATGADPAARGSANLLDAYDPDDRRSAGVPISAAAVVWWAVLNDPASAVRGTYNFSAPSGSQEETWLDQVAVPAIARDRRADLELWDRFGFALAPGSRVLATTLPDSGRSTRPGAGGLSPAQRSIRWSAFAELIHEYIHTVEHPVHAQARGLSSIGSALNEGVTDILTENVYNNTVATVRTDPTLIEMVEGTPPTGGASVPRTYLPNQYQIAYQTEVADVRAALGSASLDSFKAAYLMGHVEYVGLEPSGADRAPVAEGTGRGLDLPASVTTMAQLASTTGVGQRAIRRANRQVTNWATLPRRLNVPGWREHVTVAFRRGGRDVIETPAQIAAQHGLTVEDLNRNNRHIAAWPTLSAGMKVLIPPRGFTP